MYGLMYCHHCSEIKAEMTITVSPRLCPLLVNNGMTGWGLNAILVYLNGPVTLHQNKVVLSINIV